jgi:hypothetical protein
MKATGDSRRWLLNCDAAVHKTCHVPLRTVCNHRGNSCLVDIFSRILKTLLVVAASVLAPRVRIKISK